MRTALITGASGGIGLEVAKRLAKKNYALTLVARSEDKLKKVLKELRNSKHKIIIADLTINKDLMEVMDHISSNKYDLLINNAGVGQYGWFVQIDLEDQLNTMRLNMDAVVALSFAFLEQAAPGSALVNMGSLLAHTSLPGGAVYAATKSFIANFSESLWYEYKSKDVFVMGFNPGAADSDFHSNAGRHTKDFPAFVVSKTTDVANELIKALETRKKPRVVQGLKNRLMLFVFKWFTRSVAVGIMGKISPGLMKI